MSGQRGPYGTEVMGVSWAISTTLLPLPMTDADWGAFLAQNQPQAWEFLRIHVGGAQPRTEPTIDMNGPHSDPLQGTIYVLTASAWFRPEDLPVDCPAYVARAKEQGRG